MARQKSRLGSLPSAVMIALVTWFCSGASSALAAGEGQACGRSPGWSSSCDPGLRCEIRWSLGTARLGVCTRDPAICGGLTGAQCTSAQFCDYAAGAQCGAADQTGVCKARPAACTKEYRPVCGCDDRTYGNSCVANAAGVSVRAAGECRNQQIVNTCEYDEFNYELGASFLAIDGCNSCMCMSGGHVSCGVQCPCRYGDPAIDWISRDARECTLLDFQCPAEARQFTNHCGCGCFTRD